MPIDKCRGCPVGITDLPKGVIVFHVSLASGTIVLVPYGSKPQNEYISENLIQHIVYLFMPDYKFLLV